LFDFAGKGYARTDDALLNFMNSFYTKTSIPTDIVYTGKLMKAVISLAEDNYFPGDCKVLVIHSGGLQGNNSLAAGTLLF
jgi:1-aminocyclopropane-1-carboxylate deaminase